LVAAERGVAPSLSRRVDIAAVERARQFLDAERTRVVHSSELESITGLTRYDLCRQFRTMLGTSPHRYLLMRRLEYARDRIHLGQPLAEVACDAGFADQAHFTRVFRSTFGLTPRRYQALRTNHQRVTGVVLTGATPSLNGNTRPARATPARSARFVPLPPSDRRRR